MPLRSEVVHRKARPNPSLKRSANGRPPGPRGALVYPAPPSSTPNPDFRRFPRFSLNEINELEA